jgi:hypothetical protein
VQDLDVRNVGTAAAIRIHSGTVSSNTSTSTLEFVSSFSGSAVVGTARINSNAPAGGQSELSFLTSPTGNSPTERARIDSSGRLLVGTSTAELVQHYRQGGGNSGAFQVVTVGNGANTPSFINYGANANGPQLSIGKSRGAALGDYTIVNDGDNLGSIFFFGADGTDIRTAGAAITAQVDGTPGADDMPGRLVFSTAADGASNPTERLRITSAGVLQVADAGDITVGTTTGTKIGTATTQKIGFYNATPVVQPTAVADATDAATVITQLNALLTRMRNLGLIAT